MVNNEAKQFENIFKGFGNRSLGSSIQSVRSLVNATSSHSFDGELESIENDYKLMLDYMRKGFNDPQRGEIYNNLSSRLRLLASDLYMSYKKQHLSFFSEAARKSSNRTFSNEEIKNELEGFVTDVAMLTLEMEPQRSEKNKTLYRRHNDFMQALFCHIVVSGALLLAQSEVTGRRFIKCFIRLDVIYDFIYHHPGCGKYVHPVVG